MYVLYWIAPHYRSCIRRSCARRVIVLPPSHAALVMSRRDVHKYVGVYAWYMSSVFSCIFERDDL